MQMKEQALAKLNRSKFRSSFYLTRAEKAYLEEKGMVTIHKHAIDLLRKKIAPAYPPNDGKQTPMHGHPVFKAMHATAFCCRGCMEKWYKVPQGTELTEAQLNRIADFLIYWIEQKR